MAKKMMVPTKAAVKPAAKMPAKVAAKAMPVKAMPVKAMPNTNGAKFTPAPPMPPVMPVQPQQFKAGRMAGGPMKKGK